MRGEGNHKIPGSFAPENMEKTGAERVKYSLACQHEDAISIKFVSYAQKCPTVLCTFAVALRKRGELDGNEALADFAGKLEKATLDTIESGKMTKDLALITSLKEVQVLNSKEFILAVKTKLDELMA